jgi:hypothetical protein
LLTPAQVAAEVFGGAVPPRWILEHVPVKVRLGHRSVFYFEHDIRRWLEAHREEGNPA